MRTAVVRSLQLRRLPYLSTSREMKSTIIPMLTLLNSLQHQATHGAPLSFTTTSQFDRRKVLPSPYRTATAQADCETRKRKLGRRKLTTNASDGDGASLNNEPSDREVEEVTMNWLKNVVIGLNLCPFAEKPLREGRLKIHVIREYEDLEVIKEVLHQAIVRQELPGTTLVVAPECHPTDFMSYLAIMETLQQDFLVPNKLDSDIQVAPFHPLFEFEGSGQEGVDNWTNKSPYPIFHILREDEVSKAVDKLGGDASKIWKRNVDLLNEIADKVGIEGVRDAMAGQMFSENNEDLKEILKRHKIKLSDPKSER